MNSSFTIDDMHEAINKVMEYRRDQVMDFVDGFSSDMKVKREDITMETVVVVSSELADEYVYMYTIPFIKVIPYMDRSRILVTEIPKKW